MERPGEHIEGITFPENRVAPETISCSLTGSAMTRMDLIDPELMERLFRERDERQRLEILEMKNNN